MQLIEKDGLRMLIPEEGHLLYQDEIYSDLVYLGISASPSEWIEVPIEEVNDNE